MDPTPEHLSHVVLALCREHRFVLAGICRPHSSQWATQLRDWLAAHKHGEMDYLADLADTRINPAQWLPGTRSIILVADQYALRGDSNPPIPAHGRIARYAQGRDYHKVIKDRLHAISDALREQHPAHEFTAFVDTAPIPERELAARAGLGWIGKHTLLIHPRLGSYFLLGGILTTLDLQPPADQIPEPDRCGTCTRCIDACPTQAITPYSVDASRCISYLTIERRSPVEPEWWPKIADWVYGCDICQDVCPHNSVRPDSADVGTVLAPYQPQRRTFDLAAMLHWQEEDRRRAFAKTAMWRATLVMMKRNALVAAANAVNNGSAPHLRNHIENVAWNPNEPEEVRTFAQEIMSSLQEQPRASATV